MKDIFQLVLLALSYGNLFELVLAKGSLWNTDVVTSHKSRAGIQLGDGVNWHLTQRLEKNQKLLFISQLCLSSYICFISPCPTPASFLILKPHVKK